MNYRGASRVFGWSFHSQGLAERVTSAHEFIIEALQWFGDPDPASGSPWDQAERLVRLIRGERVLLVLDGLEPLQSESEAERGRITDPALATLLSDLAFEQRGFVRGDDARSSAGPSGRPRYGVARESRTGIGGCGARHPPGRPRGRFGSGA